MNSHLYGIFMALLSTTSWAICAILYKKWGEKLEPIALNTINSILSFFGLLAIVLITQTNFYIDNINLLKIALSGILGITIGDSLFYASLNRISPVITSIIVLAGPFFSGIFGLVFLHEIPSKHSLITIILILLITTLILCHNKEKKITKNSISGIIFAILSLCLTSFAMIIIKPVLIETSTLVVTMYRMLFSTVTLFIYAFISKKIFLWVPIVKNNNFSFKLTITVTISTLGGFWCSLISLKYCNLITTSSILALEPFFIFIFLIIIEKIKNIYSNDK